MDIVSLPVDIQDIPEVEENPYHPFNDAYHKDTQHVQKIIMARQRQMKAKHVQAVKMRFAGKSNKDIAAALNYADASISQLFQRTDVQELLSLLHYVDAAMAGPNASHRRAVLTRIMVDNEKVQPKIALQAISEMNKMDMNAHLIENGPMGGNTPTTIIINQNVLPKTNLDQ